MTHSASDTERMVEYYKEGCEYCVGNPSTLLVARRRDAIARGGATRADDVTWHMRHHLGTSNIGCIHGKLGWNVPIASARVLLANALLGRVYGQCQGLLRVWSVARGNKNRSRRHSKTMIRIR